MVISRRILVVATIVMAAFGGLQLTGDAFAQVSSQFTQVAADSSPAEYPPCQNPNAGNGVCACSDGQTLASGPDALADCPAVQCGADQLSVNGACICKLKRYVPDAVTGVCGCPAGKVDVGKPNSPQGMDCLKKCDEGERYSQKNDGSWVCVPGCPAGQVDVSVGGGAPLQCMPACPAGQQYDPSPTGSGLVCGPNCGADARLTADGSCGCLREGEAFDRATLTCSLTCGPKDVVIAKAGSNGGLQCMPACSPGEQYSQLSDGRIVCGPDCGVEAEATAAGTCQCLRAGTVFDAPTRTCGCGPKQVDVSNGMGPAQCKPACDPGQQYTQAANGAFACTCTQPGMVPDPTTHLCRCPTGTSLIDGQCSIPCPVLLGPDGKCPTAKRTGVICKNGLAPLDNAKCPVSKKASTKVVPKAPKISGPTFSIGPGLLQLGNGLFNGGNRKSSSDSNNNLNAPNNNQLFKGGK